MHPALGSSRYSLVDPGRYFTVYQKRIAAMPEVPARPDQRDEAAGSLFAIAEGFQAQVKVRIKTEGPRINDLILAFERFAAGSYFQFDQLGLQRIFFQTKEC